MMDKQQCLTCLDDAIAIIGEMKFILDEGDVGAPMAFLEAAEDAHYQLHRAVHQALRSVLVARDDDAHLQASLLVRE